MIPSKRGQVAGPIRRSLTGLWERTPKADRIRCQSPKRPPDHQNGIKRHVRVQTDVETSSNFHGLALACGYWDSAASLNMWRVALSAARLSSSNRYLRRQQRRSHLSHRRLTGRRRRAAPPTFRRQTPRNEHDDKLRDLLRHLRPPGELRDPQPDRRCPAQATPRRDPGGNRHCSGSSATRHTSRLCFRRSRRSPLFAASYRRLVSPPLQMAEALSGELSSRI
jgi:hypothetical protein